MHECSPIVGALTAAEPPFEVRDGESFTIRATLVDGRLVSQEVIQDQSRPDQWTAQELLGFIDEKNSHITKLELRLAAARAERDSMRFTDEKLEAEITELKDSARHEEKVRETMRLAILALGEERDRAKVRVAEQDATIRRLADENAALRYLIDEVRYDVDDRDDGDVSVDDPRALALSNAMRAPGLMRLEDL